jgi:molybdopterin-guanine dinucleotide biosynthesis protein A
MKLKVDPKDRFVVIMAGGRGERFWPVSREKKPKQLLALLGRKSFLQETVERVLSLVPAKNIFIITNTAQSPAVAKQVPKIPRANVVAEPMGRDTCAAVALVAALVGARSTTSVMAVLPADHVIPNAKKFQRVLEGTLATTPIALTAYRRRRSPIPAAPHSKRRPIRPSRTRSSSSPTERAATCSLPRSPSTTPTSRAGVRSKRSGSRRNGPGAERKNASSVQRGRKSCG